MLRETHVKVWMYPENTMRKIALEEHVVIPGPRDTQSDIPREYLARPEFLENYANLVDITGRRLREMDATGIDISVLSTTTPGLQGIADASAIPRLTREWNDYLADAVAGHADRLKVFAALPMSDPRLAAEELRRCVRDHGFVGAMINGYDNSGGGEPRYYDAPPYLDFWRAAAELDVPIYVHARSAPPGRVNTYAGYPELENAAWGFHIETASHMLRLILGGVFDKVPDLRIIIGHMGELLPWWAWRIDHRIGREGWRDLPATRDRPLKHTVTHYLRSNFYITTSGYFETAALQHTISVVGADRVLYAVDYPYESCREANDWFESLAIDETTKRKIAHENAARLLKLGGTAD